MFTLEPLAELTSLPQPRHVFEKSRLGAVANRQHSSDVAKRWRELSAEEKNKFELQAAEMQAARETLEEQSMQGTTAEETRGQDMLSLAQVKRLNAARLDKTLAQVSGHAAWKHGLGLSDHVSGLRASLVAPVPDSAALQELKQQFDAIFTYDPEIVTNPELPRFIRPCCTTHAGVCEADTHFNLVSRLVQQFEDRRKLCRLGGNPFLCQLKSVEPDSPETWFVVSALALRPLCHIVIHLHRVGGRLELTLKSGAMQLGTLHRVIRALLAQEASKGEDPQNLVLQVRVILIS